jgi:hypothetical protein
MLSPNINNLSRAQILQQHQEKSPPAGGAADHEYQGFQGTEDKYDFAETLARLPGDDLKAIAASAGEHAQKASRAGKIQLALSIPLWLAGAGALALGTAGLGIPALVVGSVGFFRGATNLAQGRADQNLLQDMNTLANP